MKKNIIIILIGSLIFGVFTFIFYYSKLEKEDSVKPENNKIQNIEDIINIEKNEIISIATQTPSLSLDKNIKVSLKVLNNKYNTEIKDGSTVYDLMTEIKNHKEKNFDFKYKEYPSLGIFIDEINGVKGGNGKYWIYYVNNTEASVGASKYILKEGDSILWKQE